ncbi:MAG: ROK family protein [Tropicimonas sp.]|uniref:ROK family transcriptional regulator n=1 Tax=Tropicimonas sp. TaxID=2067044 RepID=UPI003A8907C2
MHFSETKKIDQRTGRAINRRLILNLVRRSDGLSRSQLSGRTGLSAAAVGFVVNDLLADGYLMEAPPVGGKSGRRPVPLQLNASGHVAIGVRVSLKQVECVLTDLAVNVIDRRQAELAATTPGDVVGAAVESVTSLLAGQRDLPPIAGIGLSLPARIEPGSGFCVHSYRLGWKNVPIGRMLSERLGLPVVVENDTLAYGLAHQMFGLGQNSETFFALAVGEGIGCALVSDGRIRRGIRGEAGKVGHVRHKTPGPLCECGREGCLQAWHSAASLERRWAEGDPRPLPEALAGGDRDAQALVRDAGAAIGRHLAEWCIVADPEMVILGGEATAYGPAFTTAMKEALSAGHFETETPEILTDESSFYWTAGAAAVAVQQVFDFEAAPRGASPKGAARAPDRPTGLVFG